MYEAKQGGRDRVVRAVAVAGPATIVPLAPRRRKRVRPTVATQAD
jgi:hypothetical protein